MMKTSQFQWAIITYMNTLNLQKQELQSLRQQFLAVDTNGDGSITREELKKILGFALTGGSENKGENEKEKESEEESEYLEIIKAVDYDGSGYINYSEF